jgi:thioredoxin reductase (NADPH)
MTSHVHDTLIIGGGPAGLTAAIYLRRFTRDVAVVDKGNSRLRLIPVSHNYPGFPEGVPGTTLLANLNAQLERYGGSVIAGEILDLRIEDGLFVADCLPEGGPADASTQIRAHTVLLATGVADVGLPVELWREAIAFGSVRLCPVCDGFDVIDKRIAVATSEPIRSATHCSCAPSAPTSPCSNGARLRCWTTRTGAAWPPPACAWSSRRCLSVTLDAAMKPVMHTEDGEEYGADVFYPMLGEHARSGLAAALGAETAQCEELVVDAHGATTVPACTRSAT